MNVSFGVTFIGFYSDFIGKFINLRWLTVKNSIINRFESLIKEKL